MPLLPQTASLKRKESRVDRTAAAIVSAAVLGLLLAIAIGHVATGACLKAAACERTTGKPAKILWGLIQLTAEQCREAARTPPWLLVSGLVAAPSVLLTWYWRDRKRRDDHEVAIKNHRVSMESAYSARYVSAAELLSKGEIMTRINGLESLWDIAVQSEGHRAAISRTLAAFVQTQTAGQAWQEHTDSPPTELSWSAEKPTMDIATDVQVAMKLLSRSEWSEPEWSRASDMPDLRAAILHGAELQDAWLATVILVYADLKGANFQGANLERADMRHANLESVNLSKASLLGVELSGARLRSVDLREARLRGANLTKADLSQAVLESADLLEAQLQYANLELARLKAAVLTAADLRRAKLSAAHLVETKLARANLQYADLRSSILNGADLSGAHLGGADLTGALHERTVLVGATYDSQSKLPVALEPEKEGMIRTDDAVKKVARRTGLISKKSPIRVKP